MKNGNIDMTNCNCGPYASRRHFLKASSMEMILQMYSAALFLFASVAVGMNLFFPCVRLPNKLSPVSIVANFENSSMTSLTLSSNS